MPFDREVGRHSGHEEGGAAELPQHGIELHAVGTVDADGALEHEVLRLGRQRLVDLHPPGPFDQAGLRAADPVEEDREDRSTKGVFALGAYQAILLSRLPARALPERALAQVRALGMPGWIRRAEALGAGPASDPAA
jgi:hypothetical protein